MTTCSACSDLIHRATSRPTLVRELRAHMKGCTTCTPLAVAAQLIELGIGPRIARHGDPLARIVLMSVALHAIDPRTHTAALT